MNNKDAAKRIDNWDKYPYLITWCNMMGSHHYYIESEVEKALRLNAPHDVIYFDGERPVLFEDVTSNETIWYFKSRGLKKLSIAEAEDKDWRAFQDNLDWMTDEQAKDAAEDIMNKYK